MAKKLIDILSDAAVVRDEKNEKANTAERVGGVLVELANYLSAFAPVSNVTVEADGANVRLVLHLKNEDGTVSTRGVTLPAATTANAGVLTPELLKALNAADRSETAARQAADAELLKRIIGKSTSSSSYTDPFRYLENFASEKDENGTVTKHAIRVMQDYLLDTLRHSDFRDSFPFIGHMRAHVEGVPIECWTYVKSWNTGSTNGVFVQVVRTNFGIKNGVISSTLTESFHEYHRTVTVGMANGSVTDVTATAWKESTADIREMADEGLSKADAALSQIHEERQERAAADKANEDLAKEGISKAESASAMLFDEVAARKEADLGLNELIDDIKEIVLTEGSIVNKYGIVDEGGRYLNNGNFVSDSGRACIVIPVSDGAVYKITTYISSIVISGTIFTSDPSVVIGQDLTTVLGTQYAGSGTGQTITDQPLTIPQGTTFIIAQSASSTFGGEVTEIKSVKVSNVYTKSEADAKFAPKSKIPDIEGKYGVKWSVSDADDLGQRCFDAIGLTATIGLGNTDGSSDFDTIYPWSEIKRCNIKVNENGAKIVTFEGETGFSLDGSNGDVFVRIPKFCVNKFIDNGYEYRVISRSQGFVHPAFIENGKEIDEIFIAAFEGYIDSNSMLRSKGGVIPTSNEYAATFLKAAADNGDGYTLYDMRAVDAIWTLASVEFGLRNTNQYLGYGFADFMQPVKTGVLIIKESAANTNSVKVPLMSESTKRYLPVGSNITICDTEQTNILTQAKITSVTDGTDYTQFTFDGIPINVTTSCFIGSAACTTNFCETCGNDVKLNWHTGRPLFVSGTYADRQNPVRYRWIENIIGSLWHFLPDITFNNLQMYVCDNIKDYEFFKTTTPYRAIGSLLPLQGSNGQKNDNVGVNYWISELLNDIFAKGNNFGKSYNVNLTSKKAFGGYYYLANGLRCVVNGGGFDHEIRCNMLTNRAWSKPIDKWYLYGTRLMFKNLD